METKALVLFKTWDDLVFADRNQDYGAYRIRKSYFRRVVLGTGVSVALITILLILPQLFRPEIETAIAPVIAEFPGLIRLEERPLILPKDRPRPKPVTQKQTSNPLNVQVVRHEVETKPVDQTEFTSSGTEGESQIEGDGVDLGTGTSQSVGTIIKSSGPVNFAEVMPAYQGGNEALFKFLKKKLRYPPTPRRMGVEGTVFVSFVVNGDGSVTRISIISGIHPDCDEEAKRVISMLPGWIGGKQNGIPVDVKMVLPIKFNLQ